jgi:hypothetical protein
MDGQCDPGGAAAREKTVSKLLRPASETSHGRNHPAGTIKSTWSVRGGDPLLASSVLRQTTGACADAIAMRALPRRAPPAVSNPHSNIQAGMSTTDTRFVQAVSGAAWTGHRQNPTLLRLDHVAGRAGIPLRDCLILHCASATGRCQPLIDSGEDLKVVERTVFLLPGQSWPHDDVVDGVEAALLLGALGASGQRPPRGVRD